MPPAAWRHETATRASTPLVRGLRLAAGVLLARRTALASGVSRPSLLLQGVLLLLVLLVSTSPVVLRLFASRPSKSALLLVVFFAVLAERLPTQPSTLLVPFVLRF